MHNLQWMQQFVEAYGLKLAPHGKTTMSPKLFKRQIEGGAWGITVATAQQALVAARHGVQRVLMANQLVGKRNIEIVAGLLEEPGFEFFCLVDSVDGVTQLGRHLAARPGPAARPMSVLLEVGPTADQSGSRTGVRDDDQLAAVLAALDAWKPQLQLAGIEIYEGVLKEEAEIRTFLRRAAAITRRIAGDGGFARATPILSGAGSAWYDVVAEEFAAADVGIPVDVVLRPGCYLTHDVGIYRAAQNQIQQRNPIAAKMRGGLQPALQLWAYVQSVPSPDKAVIALGKRDAAFDAGYPEPALHFRPGDSTGAARERRRRTPSFGHAGTLESHRDDGSARLPPDRPGRRHSRRRHDRPRHLAPLPHLRQMAPSAAARRRLPLHRSDRHLLLNRARAHTAMARCLLRQLQAEGVDCNRVVLRSGPAHRFPVQRAGSSTAATRRSNTTARVRPPACRGRTTSTSTPTGFSGCAILPVTGVFPALSATTLDATRKAIVTMREAGRAKRQSHICA